MSLHQKASMEPGSPRLGRPGKLKSSHPWEPQAPHSSIMLISLQAGARSLFPDASTLLVRRSFQ